MIKALHLHCRGWRCGSGGSKIPHTRGATKKGGGGRELEDLCSTMTSVETFSLRTQCKLMQDCSHPFDQFISNLFHPILWNRCKHFFSSKQLHFKHITLSSDDPAHPFSS